MGGGLLGRGSQFGGLSLIKSLEGRLFCGAGVHENQDFIMWAGVSILDEGGSILVRGQLFLFFFFVTPLLL